MKPLTEAQEELLPEVNLEASVFVEGYLGVTYGEDDDIPEAVTVVTSRVMARMYTSASSTAMPFGADQRSAGMGPFNASVHFTEGSTAGGPWLSKSDKITLAPYRASGCVSVPLVRE